MADIDTQNIQDEAPVPAAPKRVRRFGITKKRVIIALVLLILLVAGIVAGLFISGKFSKKSTVAKKPTESATTNKYNRLIASGDYDTVTQTVNSNQEFANSRQGQLTLAAVAASAQKTDEAITLYLGAVKTYGLTEDIADMLAGLYASKGDKQQAISYYNKRIDLLKSSTNPLKDDLIANSQNAIKEMQK